MKILVTGGAGFIGRHLVKFLLEKGEQITIFDNYSNSTKKQISSIIESGVNVIEGDIRNINSINDAIKNKDIVIHLAAKISVIDSIINPTETFEVNVNGTKNVLSACKRNNIKKIIVASSAAVYGENPTNIKLTEDSETNPISPYGESKLEMEREIEKFVANNKINCIVLRFFNIYGIGQTSEYAGVISKFLEKISESKSLEIFGDGQQTRDFVAIEDVISSIHNAISSTIEGIFNIGSGKKTTIEELANLMISLSKKNVSIKKLTVKKGDIKNSQSDISLAKKKLGYNPKINLIKGIEKLLLNTNQKL